MLNGLAVCLGKVLELIRYFVLVVNSDCERKKIYLDAESVKVKATIWIVPEYISKKTRSKLLQLFKLFRCLGDVIGESSSCVDAINSRLTAALNSFRQLLPITTNRGVSLKNRVTIFRSCIRKVLLYGCKTWPALSESPTFKICWQRYGGFVAFGLNSIASRKAWYY